ncbi:hypothetical protein ACHAPT_009016 [Fusarium lateritium]
MSGILLAPYNDSMRLGQGYNSFLHAPCVYDAVKINQDRIGEKPASSNGSVSQIVNYSSRFVDKMSDVVKSLNVSAGSSIKNGGIVGSRNSVTVDEAKFATSDLNAIVSVKVVNQTTELLETAEWKAMEGLSLNSEAFLKIYGNCFISGFIQGGELTGVVSAKVLDVENKAAVEEAIKSQVNSCCTSSGHKMDFTLDEDTSAFESESAMRQTETTITVSWSGGGQIKPQDEEWTLESLYAAAAAFPSKVAECPQRTWAILTPYNHTKGFVVWAKDHSIQLPQFETAQVYADDLLDMYMQYKSCVNQVQSVLEEPSAYVKRPGDDSIGTKVADLVKARTSLKDQMKAISQTIDKLALHPEDIDSIEMQHPIEAPELWAARLPVRKDRDGKTGSKAIEELLPLFSFEPPEAPKIEPKPTLTDPEVEQWMSDEEKAYIFAPENRSKFRDLAFGWPVGKTTKGFFCDADAVSNKRLPPFWPDAFTISWGTVSNQNGDVEECVFGKITTRYQRTHLGHGCFDGTFTDSNVFLMGNDEYVNRVYISDGDDATLVPSLRYLELMTNKGNAHKYGHPRGRGVVVWSPPTGFQGLVGFYGAHDHNSLYRLGPIWGRHERTTG